jgi:rhodanese-related sulfurtransferase
MGKSRFDVNDLLAEARATLSRVTPEQAFDAQRNGALVLDTRVDADRSREGVIPESLHTPLSVIQWVVDSASGYANPAVQGLEQTLIVICNEGYSSSLAAASLKRLGFVNATDLIGGYRGWKAAGLPTCEVDRFTSARLPQRWTRAVVKGALYRVFLRLFQ